MDPVILKALTKVSKAQGDEAVAAAREETNAQLGDYFARPHAMSDLQEFAFDITNLVWSDVMTEDITSQIIEVKTVGLGEVDYLETDLRGMNAYWQGEGGQIFSDQIRYSRTQMPREEIVGAIDIHKREIATNFWGSFDKLKSQLQQKARQLPVLKLVELIQASINAVDNSTYYGTFPASTFDDTNFDPILDAVADKSGGQVTIMGSRQAVRKLTNIGITYSENIAEKVFNTGILGVYKGYPVVQVENFETFEGSFALPSDEIWIVGKGAGRLTWYGNSPDVQLLPQSAFWTRWEFARVAGLLLLPERGNIGRVVLT